MQNEPNFTHVRPGQQVISNVGGSADPTKQTILSSERSGSAGSCLLVVLNNFRVSAKKDHKICKTKKRTQFHPRTLHPTGHPEFRWFSQSHSLGGPVERAVRLSRFVAFRGFKLFPRLGEDGSAKCARRKNEPKPWLPGSLYASNARRGRIADFRYLCFLLFNYCVFQVCRAEPPRRQMALRERGSTKSANEKTNPISGQPASNASNHCFLRPLLLKPAGWSGRSRRDSAKAGTLAPGKKLFA
jgi:hypothetical protein